MILTGFPFAFWISLFVLVGVGAWAWSHRSKGWGLPATVVSLVTVAWYHGDALYNDYLGTYALDFQPQVLKEAWWQVAVFGLSLGVFVSVVPRIINAKYAGRPSQVEALLSGRRPLASLQPVLENLGLVLGAVWACVFGVALWRTGGDFLGLAAPYLGHMAYPWARGQIATSVFDSLATLFGTINVICAALFGVFAALSRPGATQNLMIFLMALSWPMYLLDRTRNVMLTVLVPGVLSFVFLRWRGRVLAQTILLIVGFLAVDNWFKFVIANRSETSIIAAVVDRSRRVEGTAETKHQGWNMFEELCYVNRFIDEGSFVPANGRLYYVNLVNPIPRSLWPGKPTMGLEYSLLRGQHGDETEGTSATVCVGMIGSGLVNFGQRLGPVAAAFLMSLWCAFLARLDLTGQDPARLKVYLIGLVITFNFGRDITFLVAYPFLFAYALLWAWRKISPYSMQAPTPAVAINRRSISRFRGRVTRKRPLGSPAKSP